MNGEATSTLPSPITSHVLVASPNERTLRFPIKLLVGQQTVETTALIDSGATGNFIDLGLLSLANFPLKKLPQPIRAFNVDGTANQRGTILWKAHTRMILPHGPDDLELMVVSLGRPCYDCSFLFPCHIVRPRLTNSIDFILTVLPERPTLKRGFLCYTPRIASFFSSHRRLLTSCVITYTAPFPLLSHSQPFPLYPPQSFY